MIHADVLGERARLTPDRTALVFVPTGERFSYAELDLRARRLGAFLTSRAGVSRGDRVALLAHNRVEYLDAFFAAAKSGFVLVPLGTRLTAGELAAIVMDAEVSAVLYDGSLAPTVGELRGLVDVPAWVSLDEPLGSGDLTTRGLAGDAPSPASGSADPDGRHSSNAAAPDPEDLLCLLYTSGTTGRPKGVMVPHRMVAWNGYNTVVSWQLREDDVSPIFTPLYHAGGLGAFLVPLLTIGGTIVLHASFEPGEVWRTIERERCTVVLGVPTIWKLLRDDPAFESADLSSVRWLISGGAPLPRHLIDAYQARGLVFKQGYGMTEVGVNCFAMSVEESRRKAGSIGKPMMMTGARLLGEDGRESSVDEVGELLLRGPHVCRGYWRNPEATAAALDPEGWFHTGDLARRDAEGFFTIAGRKKDMIISGGVNVYPAEVEGQLLLHPDVEDAAVVGVPHDTWGEVGVAFVVAREGTSPAPSDLTAFLSERLARFKLPRDYRYVDALPRTAYGKVVKVALRDRYLQGS